MTSAAMKACKNAISSNSIPAFRRGAILLLPISIVLKLNYSYSLLKNERVSFSNSDRNPIGFCLKI